jgi:putative ABC transport system permease protein
MFKYLFANYLVSAFRSLARHKMNLILTIIGLSTGLAAALLIGLFTLNENSYDEFQPDAERTYRVVMHHIPSGGEFPMTTPRGYQHLLKVNGVDDVMNLMRTTYLMSSKLQMGSEYLKLNNLVAAPENLTNFISMDVLYGDLATALIQPNKIALSKSEAVRLFGITNVVGKTFVMTEDAQTMEVVAVFSDLPDNSHYAMSSIIAAKPFMQAIGKHSYTYVKLAQDANIDVVEAEVTKILNRIWQDQTNDIRFYLQPLMSIHLAPNFNTDMKAGGSSKTVLISVALSILILLISSFNYINMSIAQAGIRAKEVGVRKVLGATKSQLVMQFLTESVIIALISALLACGIVELLMPSFNQLVGRELIINNWSQYIIGITAITVSIGIASGLYPAFFISSFSVHRVLSGDFGRGKTAILIRKLLMVLQSALSVSLIIAAITLYLQLNYLQNLAVNYEKDQRITILGMNGNEIYSKENQSLYRDLTKIAGVISATPTDFDLTKSTNAGAFVTSVPGVSEFKQQMGFAGVGFNAVKTLGLQLAAGRDFSTQYQSDWFNKEQSTVAIIIPESVLTIAGYKNAKEAIGQVWQFDAGGQQNLKGKIVGVIKDVKIGSSRDNSEPVMFVCGLPVGGVYSLVLEVEDQYSVEMKREVIAFVEQRLKINAVEIQLVKNNYFSLYKAENQLVQMVALFSGLAIFLTCIGMFGLAAFSAQQRSREVAIRKVIGASRFSLVTLLTNESIVLIGLSLLIAFPTSYYFIDEWLISFNDRIAQSIVIYVVAASLVSFITWLTVATIAIKIASTKPSASLRHE